MVLGQLGTAGTAEFAVTKYHFEGRPMVEEVTGTERTNYLEKAGDCEIRGIVFDHPNVQIFFFDPYFEKSFYFLLIDVNQFVFSTNHVQNVVSEVHIFESFETAMRNPEFAKSYGQMLSHQEYIDITQEKAILFIEPSTGGDVIAQFGEIKLFVKDEE